MLEKQKVLSDFYKNVEILKNKIHSQETKLIDLLTKYETHDAARDEITRSIETLLGAKAEFSDIDNPLSNLKIATFFPLNLPLYSLILFGIMPSAFSKNVFIRPPDVMKKVLDEIWEILDISTTFPALTLNQTPRHIFMSLYASEADAIIFTGKYKNALDVHQKCPDSLLLYNGSGVNPFLILESADIDLAVKKSVEMRCFNSGQDCAGPDAFFIHDSIVDEYIEKLQVQLSKLKVGDTKDSGVSIGPTLKESYIEELVDWISDNDINVVWGGEIDTINHFVHPTIARSKLSDLSNPEFHEFFAPFFYIVSYSTEEELESIGQSTDFRDRSMYVSVFGDSEVVAKYFDSAKILKNSIVNDVERGNNEYGGYGEKANFILFGDQKIVSPILISRDLHRML